MISLKASGKYAERKIRATGAALAGANRGPVRPDKRLNAKMNKIKAVSGMGLAERVGRAGGTRGTGPCRNVFPGSGSFALCAASRKFAVNRLLK